jgi:aspartate-semialdehyde dehydrogenase
MTMRVAVVGATGAVGREMLRILAERSFPADELLAFATERSQGRKVAYGDSEVVVQANRPGALQDVDLALWSAGGGPARDLIPAAVEAGTICVDNSSAFRMADGVPLVIPEINADALASHRGLVANPNCTAITVLMPLAPLHRAFGLREVVLSSYQSVSGTGTKGIRELAEQVEKLRGQEEMLGRPDPASLPVGEVFGKTIAFNVVPRVDVFREDGFTVEERKVADETRKILELPDLPVHATCVRVPVMVGHGVSVLARFGRDASPDAAREVLSQAEGVRVVDDPSADAFPTSLDSAGIDDVLVGRIRQPEGEPGTLLYFAAGDNLRKGAALNAVQIAEHLVR